MGIHLPSRHWILNTKLSIFSIQYSKILSTSTFSIGPRKIKFIPVYFCAMYLENIMLPLVPLVALLYLLYLLPECP